MHCKDENKQTRKEEGVSGRKETLEAKKKNLVKNKGVEHKFKKGLDTIRI
jgi:hypothetical protein